MIGARGLALLRRFEALRYHAYDDGTGIFTIGYGHTTGVKPTDICTQPQAEQWLMQDADNAEQSMLALLQFIELSPAQRDALTCFVFNLGAGSFEQSELRAYVKAADHFSAARSFAGWTRAGGKRMRGLLRRRLAEALLYCEDPWPT